MQLVDGQEEGVVRDWMPGDAMGVRSMWPKLEEVNRGAEDILSKHRRLLEEDSKEEQQVNYVS